MMGMPWTAKVCSALGGLWLLFALYSLLLSSVLSWGMNSEHGAAVAGLVDRLGGGLLEPAWQALGEQGRAALTGLFNGVAPSLQFAGRFRLRIADVGGFVETCCCAIDQIESDQPALHALLSELVARPYFRFFRVNYEQPCPFWVEEHLCTAVSSSSSTTDSGSSADPVPCGICECPPEAVPALVKSKDMRGLVNTTLEPGFAGFADEHQDHQWIDWDPTDAHMAYVDLALNPERYTGYRGGEARQLWQIIYEENCFFELGEDGGQCMEERIFFRLISGLHGSTTVHLCSQHQRDDAAGQWLPNLDMFIWRLGVFPERIKNVYFNYIFMLRALAVLHELIAADAQHFDALFATDDAEAAALVRRFYASAVFQSDNKCAAPLFDESSLFQGDNSVAVRDAFRNKFRNISRIMDCVACESCKLHAKLQVLGMGTALKLLFHDRPASLLPYLQRNEVMALFQTAHKFSESIDLVHQLRRLERSQVVHSTAVLLAFCFAVVSLAAGLIVRALLVKPPRSAA